MCAQPDWDQHAYLHSLMRILQITIWVAKDPLCLQADRRDLISLNLHWAHMQSCKKYCAPVQNLTNEAHKMSYINQDRLSIYRAQEHNLFSYFCVSDASFLLCLQHLPPPSTPWKGGDILFLPWLSVRPSVCHKIVSYITCKPLKIFSLNFTEI